MQQSSPNLQLPFLQPSQAQKHVTHNEALRHLDTVVQLSLRQIGATNPPAAAEDGDTHAVGPGATGAWAGQDGKLAVWLGTSWQFLPPQEGWRAWDAPNGRLVVWDGSAWVAPHSDLDNLDRIGIGTSADTTNRLSVQSDATLLSHDGTDHQVKVNKADDDATASLLFQSNWTGHAEMGLMGQTAFSIKVSQDGTGWTEALRLDEATGHASGSAVQATTMDATPGRLMTTGAFGLGATGFCPVIQSISAADTPSGTYSYQPTTPGSGSLPAELKNGTGVIRIDRYSNVLLRQTAWRNNFEHGAWTRVRFGGNWQEWQQIFDQSNILGPVSQSSGQPTGAIIERGTSADGDYVRFADGTQICTRRFDIDATSHIWTFPAIFAAPETISLQALPRHSGAARIVTETGDPTASGVSFGIWDATGAAAAAGLHVTATGRWF